MRVANTSMLAGRPSRSSTWNDSRPRITPANHTVSMAGASTGTSTYRKVRQGPRPHTRAASSRDASSCRMAGMSRMVMMGMVLAVRCTQMMPVMEYGLSVIPNGVRKRLKTP